MRYAWSSYATGRTIIVQTCEEPPIFKHFLVYFAEDTWKTEVF